MDQKRSGIEEFRAAKEVIENWKDGWPQNTANLCVAHRCTANCGVLKQQASLVKLVRLDSLLQSPYTF